MTKNQIIEDLWRSQFMNDIILKMTSGHALTDDLKSEVFLILMEMDEVRIINAWQNKYLNYMVINIIKKQYWSSTSPFHKTWRKEKPNDIEVPIEDIPDESTEWQDKIIEEAWKIVESCDVVDRELFKIYYKRDRYDRFFGDLRDKDCKKAWSSTRKIEKKLMIKGIEGQKGVTIDHATIALSIRRTLQKIRKHLGDGGFYDRD